MEGAAPSKPRPTPQNQCRVPHRPGKVRYVSSPSARSRALPYQHEGTIKMIIGDLEDIYKLSPIQQGVLFHHLYAPESEVYFEQFSWTIHSKLNLPAFTQAWQYVVDQHPILRTAFLWEDIDEPLQIVRRHVQPP